LDKLFNLFYFIFLSSKATLTNYWPMSNLSDVVSNRDLYNGVNFTYTYDRFGNPNQAIYLNNGYLQIPFGVYFSGDFTVSVWLYWNAYRFWSRIFEFGNGQEIDNVGLVFLENTPELYGAVIQDSAYSTIQTSGINIQLNQWYHVAFTLKEATATIYINGIKATSGALFVPKNIVRSFNFIGKSTWSVSNPKAVIDDLKIYNGAMSEIEILNDFKSTSSSKF
jgi:hypothetical protein